MIIDIIYELRIDYPWHISFNLLISSSSFLSQIFFLLSSLDLLLQLLKVLRLPLIFKDACLYDIDLISISTYICRIVESVGQGVTEFNKGDHVLTVFTGECGKCRQCTSGKSNICQVLGLERRGVMHSDQKTRFFIKGKPIYHYCAVSSFSEYIVVHSGCAVKVSSNLPLEKICLLSCGVAAGKLLFITSH